MGFKAWSMKLLTSPYQRLISAYSVRRLSRTRFYKMLRNQSIEVIYMLLFFSLTAGILNTILEGSKNPFAIIVPSRSTQTWSEAIINIFSLGLGGFSFYLLYRSSRQSVLSRSANFLVFVGLTSLILAAIVAFFMIQVKG